MSDEDWVKKEPKEELIDEYPSIPFDNQISTLAVVGDEMAIKEEPLFDNDVKEEPVDEYESNPCDNQIFGSDFVREEMFFNEDEFRNDAVFSSEAAEEEKRNRPKRKSSNPLRYMECMENSNEDGKPPEKQSKSTNKTSSQTVADKRKSSHNVDSLSKSETKKSRGVKENGSELKCIECYFRTRNVSTWISHLRDKHSTNPALAGVVLRCECRHESTSKGHMYSCDIANFTVVRKRDGPIRRITDAKTTPKCVLCESYPKTAIGYAQHLRLHHKTTLKSNGIYLLCSCGSDVRYYENDPNHSKKCNGREYTLHKLNQS